MGSFETAFHKAKIAIMQRKPEYYEQSIDIMDKRFFQEKYIDALSNEVLAIHYCIDFGKEHYFAITHINSKALITDNIPTLRLAIKLANLLTPLNWDFHSVDTLPLSTLQSGRKIIKEFKNSTDFLHEMAALEIEENWEN